jgi:hypothetical protein
MKIKINKWRLAIIAIICGAIIVFFAFINSQKKINEGMENKVETNIIVIKKEDETNELSFGEDDFSDIPNTIWAFWEGEQTELVKKCINSWKFYNPTYKIIILNKQNYKNYITEDIDNFKFSKDFIQRFSDYVRVCILEKYGGIWMDASIICHKPLKWINAIQNKKKVDFIAYYINASTIPEYLNYSPILENWFFACIAKSSFITDWKTEFLRTNNYDKITDYIESIKTQNVATQNIGNLEYLTMHYSAQLLLQQNPTKYKMILFCAENGPFKCFENNWDRKKAADLLCNENTYRNFYKFPIVKITSDLRGEIESYGKMDNLFLDTQ